MKTFIRVTSAGTLAYVSWRYRRDIIWFLQWFALVMLLILDAFTHSEEEDEDDSGDY